VTADGTVVFERGIVTRADQFGVVFGRRERMRILRQSSTESEWVATCLEDLGHEVIVADPNFAAMCGTRTRRIKTDPSRQWPPPVRRPWRQASPLRHRSEADAASVRHLLIPAGS
jgi:hypothetical protein